MNRKKLKHATGWAMFIGWIFFGVSCSGAPRPSPEKSILAVLDIIELACPPEITVGDCHARVRAWLPVEANPYVPADAGKD